MATIVSTAMFINELLVAGVENVEMGICQELTAAVLKYEPEYLKEVLGLSFYTAVFTAIGDGSSVDQKWKDIIDGCTYTVSGRQYEWKGLRYYTTCYIYYWYQRNAFSVTTITGQGHANVENTTVISPAEKMVKAYNDSVDGAHWLWHFLYNNQTIYADYNPAYVDRYCLRKINAIGV